VFPFVLAVVAATAAAVVEPCLLLLVVVVASPSRQPDWQQRQPIVLLVERKTCPLERRSLVGQVLVVPAPWQP
jgi:hypothetical protein